MPHVIFKKKAFLEAIEEEKYSFIFIVFLFLVR
jgi:hypothetical protein